MKNYIVNEKTGCWEWQRGLSDQGYAKNHRGKVHIQMYEEKYGPVPPGLELDHLCRNRGCVNPDHVEPVSHAINCQRGSRAKLSPEKVMEIREKHAHGASRVGLAEEYGVSTAAIGDAINGKRWKNLPGALTEKSYTRGERNSQARLSEADVREIRTQRASGISTRIIGERFGISQIHVYRVVSGESWRHVK